MGTMKYLVVTGGTMSGTGKGTIISCIGVVLKSMGCRVTALKIDPYLNLDAGTISPSEHGEVFVLKDGGEVDLDLGNYERFLDISLTKDHNITTGKIYDKVIRKERKGGYLGETVQIVPHITDTIQEWIKNVSVISVDDIDSPPDVCLVEVGGTVGDIESSFYLEALQQLFFSMGPTSFCSCHVSVVPCVRHSSHSEQKTKPTQRSVKILREAGLMPDFIFCRSEYPITNATRGKIAVFCQVSPRCVISVHNVENPFKVPGIISSQGFGELIAQKLQLPFKYLENNLLEQFTKFTDKLETAAKIVTIGIVGKYVGKTDSYLSVLKALEHASVKHDVQCSIKWVDSTFLETLSGMETCHLLSQVDGVVCPGGFGDRGIEGMIKAAKFCRENKVPYLGICLGMQIAIVEFCRSVLHLPNANSEEFDKSTINNVIKYMPELDKENLGGTMRVGLRASILNTENSLAYRIYNGPRVIFERHRHRYEVNPKFVESIESKGFLFTGKDIEGNRMAIGEMKNHPFFFCTQFHPEFTSRPFNPNPCFAEFVQACVK